MASKRNSYLRALVRNTQTAVPAKTAKSVTSDAAVLPSKRNNHRSFLVEVKDPGSDHVYLLRVKREQLPVTIRTASTIHTLQGTTTAPGMIFHWKFPRFFSEELRWLATYVALSRPPSLQQLISVGMPIELRAIIEGGPPEGILTRFRDMFHEKEELTHRKAAEMLVKLGWNWDD